MKKESEAYKEARKLLNKAWLAKVNEIVLKDLSKAENAAEYIEKGTKEYDNAMEKIADKYLFGAEQAEGSKKETDFKKARQFATKITDPLHRAKELLEIAEKQSDLSKLPTFKYAKLIVKTRRVLKDALDAAKGAKKGATYTYYDGESKKVLSKIDLINEIEKKRDNLEKEIGKDNNLRAAAGITKRRLTIFGLVGGALSGAILALEIISNLMGIGINPLGLIGIKKNTQQVVQTEKVNQEKQMKEIKKLLATLQTEYDKLSTEHDKLKSEYDDLKSEFVVSCGNVDFEALTNKDGKIVIRSTDDIKNDIKKADDIKKAELQKDTANGKLNELKTKREKLENEKTEREKLDKCLEKSRDELKSQLCTSEFGKFGSVAPLKNGPLCDGPIYRIVEDKNKKRVVVPVYNEKEDCPKDCKKGGEREESTDLPYE